MLLPWLKPYEAGWAQGTGSSLGMSFLVLSQLKEKAEEKEV